MPPDFDVLPVHQKVLVVALFVLVLIAGGYIRAWIGRNRRRY